MSTPAPVKIKSWDESAQELPCLCTKTQTPSPSTISINQPPSVHILVFWKQPIEALTDYAFRLNQTLERVVVVVGDGGGE